MITEKAIYSMFDAVAAELNDELCDACEEGSLFEDDTGSYSCPENDGRGCPYVSERRKIDLVCKETAKRIVDLFEVSTGIM